MIKSNQALPPAIQTAAYAYAKKAGLSPPPPSALKPTPANLKNHPVSEAVVYGAIKTFSINLLSLV